MATASRKWLETFFEEKNLPEVTFEVKGPLGTDNMIPNTVVIDYMLAAPESERKQIVKVLRKIDFANGDVNDFLKHCAGALARDF